MDELQPLDLLEGLIGVDVLPSGDIYMEVESNLNQYADIVMSRAEVVELIQLLLESIKHGGSNEPS